MYIINNSDISVGAKTRGQEMSKYTTSVRPDVRSAGSFVAVPSAFERLQSDIKFVPKLEFKTVYSEESEDLSLETIFASDKILFDFGGLEVSEIDMEKVDTDLDYLKEKVNEYPDELMQMIEKVSADSPDIQGAAEIMEEIEMTEDDFIEAGGGFLFTAAVIAGAVLVSSCVSSNNKIKHESTMPDIPPGEEDAGPDEDGGE